VQCGFSEIMQRIFKCGDIQNTRTSLTPTKNQELIGVITYTPVINY